MRFPTGLIELDEELGGGFPTGSIALIYGEEKSGKTSLALKLCALAARRGRAAYIDCSNRLHPLRLEQILRWNRVDRSRLLILSIESFLQQEEVVLRLYDYPPPAPLIVLDDFTFRHRLEIKGDVKQDTPIYERLAFQLAALKEAAMKKDIAIVVVGQVHTLPDTGETRAVAHRILTYWSDYVLRVVRRFGERCGRIWIEKPERKGAYRFRIAKSGVTSC